MISYGKINCDGMGQDVIKSGSNQQFSEKAFDCLLGVKTPEMLYKELKHLLSEGNTDKIKTYINSNDTLRTSMHEAAHVIVGKTYGLNLDSVVIGESNNKQRVGAQNMIGGTSTGQTKWCSLFQFSDKSIVHVSLAGYVAECGLGIDYKEANQHAQQDFNDILNWPGFCDLYDEGWKPKDFDEKGNLVGEQVVPKLSSKDVQKELQHVMVKEMQKVSNIIKNNVRDLFKLGIELYKNRNLDNRQIDSILGVE